MKLTIRIDTNTISVGNFIILQLRVPIPFMRMSVYQNGFLSGPQLTLFNFSNTSDQWKLYVLL